MKVLAKLIQDRLTGNKSCTLSETDLERVWPAEKIKRLKREKKIHAFAKEYGLTARIHDPGIRVTFRKGTAP